MRDDYPALVSIELSLALDRGVHAAAGALQAEIAAIGWERVAEADLRSAVRAALQAQLGRGVVPEARVPDGLGWTKGLGPFDVAVLGEPDSLAYIELKWCRRPDNLAEALWDALKLLPHTSEPASAEAFLIYGAPLPLWEQPGDRPVELFADCDHDIRDLLSRFEKCWRWLLTGNKRARPRELRSEFNTELVSRVPIHCAADEPWELRCARVQAADSRILFFDDEGWLSDDQPAFGPPAPEARYIDTADDIQIDLSTTLPLNGEILRELDTNAPDRPEDPA